jgi:hypothetical protein
MFNCYKLSINGRLFCIVKTELEASYIFKLLQETCKIYSYEISGDYIDGLNF